MIHTLHGNFGLPSDWTDSLPPALPSTLWNLWEIRRHHDEARTLTGFATWFNHRVESLHAAGPRTLAGYSLGGRLALHVFLDRPDLWSRLIILSAHPGLANDDERAARRQSDTAWGERCRALPWPEVAHSWNAQAVLASHGSADPAPTEPWRHEIADAFVDWSLGCQEDLVPRLQADSTLRGYWLTGALDSKFSLVAGKTVNRLPGMRLEMIPGIGHRLLKDAPLTVRQYLGRGPAMEL